MYGGRAIWEICVLSLNFDANLELLLKIKFIKNLKNKKSTDPPASTETSAWARVRPNAQMGKCSTVSDPACQLLLWTGSWFYSLLQLMPIVQEGQEVGPRILLGEEILPLLFSQSALRIRKRMAGLAIPTLQIFRN